MSSFMVGLGALIVILAIIYFVDSFLKKNGEMEKAGLGILSGFGTVFLGVFLSVNRSLGDVIVALGVLLFLGSLIYLVFSYFIKNDNMKKAGIGVLVGFVLFVAGGFMPTAPVKEVENMTIDEKIADDIMVYLEHRSYETTINNDDLDSFSASVEDSVEESRTLTEIKIFDSVDTGDESKKTVTMKQLFDKGDSIDLTISGIEKANKEYFKIIDKHEEVDTIYIHNQLLVVDKSGAEKISQFLTISLDRETLNKINWDNFDTNKFESIADGYELNKDLQ